MRKFKYKGDGPVDVPALGLVDLTPNSDVEVEDPAVADTLDASDLWEHIPDPARSRAAKKAAATREATAEASPPAGTTTTEES